MVGPGGKAVLNAQAFLEEVRVCIEVKEPDAPTFSQFPMSVGRCEGRPPNAMVTTDDNGSNGRLLRIGIVQCGSANI